MTGANGYVGSRITTLAVEQGYIVYGLVRSEAGAENLPENDAKSFMRLAAFVYGLGGSCISLLMRMAADAGQAIAVNGGASGATFFHVNDAASLHLLVAQKATSGEIFDAASGNDATAGEVIEATAKLVNVPVKDLSFEKAEPVYGMLASLKGEKLVF